MGDVSFHFNEYHGISDSICAALRAAGYQTEKMVGHSEYRIDIGVIDPNDSNTYLLGILLDGDCYGNAKTTRDREISQIEILRGLGWNIHRVWTMDWWDNREKELTKIMDAIHLADKDRSRPQKMKKEERRVVENREMKIAALVHEEKPAALVKARPVTIPVYHAKRLEQKYCEVNEFLSPGREAEIRQKITSVINQEAPISRGLLTRRVIQSFGITRSGSRIQTFMDQQFQYLGLSETGQDGTIFFWDRTQNPEEYAGFRCCGTEADKRDAKDVPRQEAANAVCYILLKQVSLPLEDLIRETAKILGYNRAGQAVASMVSAGIDFDKEKGRIVPAVNGKWILTESGEQHAARTEALLQ